MELGVKHVQAPLEYLAGFVFQRGHKTFTRPRPNALVEIGCVLQVVGLAVVEIQRPTLPRIEWLHAEGVVRLDVQVALAVVDTDDQTQRVVHPGIGIHRCQMGLEVVPFA